MVAMEMDGDDQSGDNSDALFPKMPLSGMIQMETPMVTKSMVMLEIQIPRSMEHLQSIGYGCLDNDGITGL